MGDDGAEGATNDGTDNTSGAFFTGTEAFAEVAKVDGTWDWALCGPEPETLRICGGGNGSIDDLREALSGNVYGLLRLHFGEGEKAKTKWVYVHMVEGVDFLSAGLTDVERGQAEKIGAEMEQVIGKYAPISVKIEFKRLQDCKADYIIPKLAQEDVADAALLTVENYMLAQSKSQACQDPEAAEKDKAVVEEIRRLSLLPDLGEIGDIIPKGGDRETTEAADPAVEADAGTTTSEGGARLRKKVKLFKKGDFVQVYSQAQNYWHDDGLIIATLQESGMHDGFIFPAGSMKAQYANGRRFKWVTPTETEAYLKVSERPVPPKPIVGELLKEAHGIFTNWERKHFELSKGFLQWWVNASDARVGVRPLGVVPLLGAQYSARKEDCTFNVRTPSTKGVIYTFNALNKQNQTDWINGLRQHARYCNVMRKYIEKKEGDKLASAGEGRP